MLPVGRVLLHSGPCGRRDFAVGRDPREVHDPPFCSENPSAQGTWEPQSVQRHEKQSCCVAGERKWNHRPQRVGVNQHFSYSRVITQGGKGSPFQSTRHAENRFHIGRPLDGPPNPAGCVRACILDPETSGGSFQMTPHCHTESGLSQIFPTP